MGIHMTNSIVRELVPRSSLGEVDESATLSASDLITILENIGTRSEEIKDKVHKTLTNYNTDFFRIIAQSNQTVTNVGKLAKELKQVLELLGDREVIVVNEGITDTKKASAEYIHETEITSEVQPVDVEICRLAAEVHRLGNTVKERKEALVVVETLSALYDHLLATESKFLPGSLVDAAKGMVILRARLGLQNRSKEEVPQNEGHHVRAFKLLQDEWSNRYNRLLDVLEELFSKAVLLDERKAELAVTPYIAQEMREFDIGGGTVDLSSIFIAMDVLGVLDIRLAKLGDSIIKTILGPILKNSQAIISTKVYLVGAESTSQSVLACSCKNQIGEPVPEVLYPKIVEVIKFLHTYIFGNNDGTMSQFGRVVWPRLAEAIITDCLSKAVPNKTSQLKDFEKIAELTGFFEKDLAREGFIPNFDQDNGDRLSKYASDVEVHFALKKKKRVLGKARDLLIESDYNLSKSVWKTFKDGDIGKGVDQSMYVLPGPCAVSLLARSLLGIVYDTLEDACLSTPRTAHELYHASRDAILLYRAIIPVKLGGIPDRMGMDALCHNDCLYIAHEMLTFLYQYREELPPSLKKIFTFVDLVPIFRHMAKEFLAQHIQALYEKVMQALDHASGFQYTYEPKRFQLAEQALEEVFDTIASVDTMWKPILAHGLYKNVIGDLINIVVRRIVAEIITIEDIAVHETLQLQKLLVMVKERLPCFLAPAVVDVSERCHVVEAEALENIPYWPKLQKLINLLDMSLVSINKAWESGVLSSAGFSPSEVQKLIRAIFSETPLREECLHRIELARLVQ